MKLKSFCEYNQINYKLLWHEQGYIIMLQMLCYPYYLGLQYK